MRRLIVFAVLAWGLWTAAPANEPIVIAAEDNWYPYSAVVDKRLVGRTVDLVKAAYEAAGAPLVLDAVPFKRGWVNTKDGHYAGVFNAGVNDEAFRDFLIPRNPVAVSQQVVVARRAQPFSGKPSFNGRRLVLAIGFTYPSDITGDPKNTIARVVGDVNSLRMIAAGRADFTIIDRFVLESLLAREAALSKALDVVGVLDEGEKIYVLFARTAEGQRAMALFDQGMDLIERNGIKQKIEVQWAARFR